jgi:FixJ family two-component response regulator
MNADRLVCIVDDDGAVRDSISLMLGLKGYDCRTYANGAAFLTAIPNRPCSLILDIKMGEMDGLMLQEQVTFLNLSAEIIFLTAFADVDVMRKAFINSAVDFLEKPVVMDQLLAALDKAFERLKKRQELNASDLLLDLLTPREKEVLDVISQGLTHRQIGDLLGISPRTVEVHKSRIMEKLGVKTLAELIKKSLKNTKP